MENEQMSSPLAAIALKIPPKNPTAKSTIACHIPKFTIESQVFLLCSLEIDFIVMDGVQQFFAPIQEKQSKGKAEPDANKS